jgi:D-alanyl-D-alanine carboxypeptidase
MSNVFCTNRTVVVFDHPFPRARLISPPKVIQNMLLIMCVIMMHVAVSTSSASAEKYASIVVDAKTGETIYSRHADSYRYPASLTKVMTLYVLFEELESGRMTMNTPLSVSKYASSRPPTKLGLRAGSTIRVKDAIKALITRSANDVAVVVAENVSGSVPAFAARMTRTAHALGMRKTTFKNPSGLPNSSQRTTARDMATLGRAIQDRFPQYYKLFRTTSFSYGKRTYRNHNKLLGRVRGVDGIKTGYTRASGFNLLTNVETGGRHVVAVVMGGRTGSSRDRHMTSLISKYLPQASRGARTAPKLLASAQLAVKKAPMPRKRPVTQPALIAVATQTAPATAQADDTLLALAPVPAAKAAALTGQMSEPSSALAQSDAIQQILQKTEAQTTPEAASVTPPAAMAVSTHSQQPRPQKPVTVAMLSKQYEAVALEPVLPPAPITTVRTTTVAVQTAQPVAAGSVPVTNSAASSLSGSEHRQRPAPKAPPLTTASVTPATSTPQPAMLPQQPVQERKGYAIQIGAVEGETYAQKLLNEAKKSASSVLSRAEPYTETVEHRGTTLWRARFTGFASMDKAHHACRTLKQQSFKCLAIRL